MAGDRSNNRDTYPDILNMTDLDRQKLIRDIPLNLPNNIRPSDLKKSYDDLYHDICLIRKGVPKSDTDWPPDILQNIRTTNFNMCMERLIRGSLIYNEAYSYAISQIGRERTDLLKSNYPPETIDELNAIIKVVPSWTEYLLDFPILRIEASKNWKKPFDAMDPLPSQSRLDVPEDLLNQMHNYINRAHGWFGVGEWQMAITLYIKALIIGLASYNFDAVEMITRFIIDSYIASNQITNALSIGHDFFASPAYIPAAQTLSHEQIIESIIVGLILNNNFRVIPYWKSLYHDILISKNKEVNHNFDSWNIYELLYDVFSYKNDIHMLHNLKNAKYSLGKIFSM